MNVALTRARFALWIVGNAKTLRAGGKGWAALLDDAADRRCLLEGHQDKKMANRLQGWRLENAPMDALDPTKGAWDSAIWDVSALHLA